MRRVAFALGTLLLGACTFGEKSVPPGEDRPVVHAVLNPWAIEQTVLVERTLTGRVAVTGDTAARASDPIVSGGGVPIDGARVTVVGPDGATATAIETTFVPPEGGASHLTGVYRFANSTPGVGGGESQPPGIGPSNRIRVTPGARYRLRVELPDGRVTTGEAVVPGAAPVPPPDFAAREFNIDTDTLRLRWDAVPGARSYALRIDGPDGAFFMFNDSTSVSLTGELRNLFADRLPRAFRPGFTQNVYVAAVDTNYFDYYRSTNNPFTGSGIINRLTGGIGLFGAYVPVMTRALFVRANEKDPFDGRYFSPTVSGDELLRLWVDGRGNGVAEVTGAYRLPGQDQYGVLGVIQGDAIHLRALDPQDARRVIRVIDGTIKGDTIRAQVKGIVQANDPGARVFVKRAATPSAP